MRDLLGGKKIMNRRNSGAYIDHGRKLTEGRGQILTVEGSDGIFLDVFVSS